MMAKIQNLSELSQSFSFTEYDFYEHYRRTFESTVLGKIDLDTGRVPEVDTIIHFAEKTYGTKNQATSEVYFKVTTDCQRMFSIIFCIPRLRSSCFSVWLRLLPTRWREFWPKRWNWRW